MSSPTATIQKKPETNGDRQSHFDTNVFDGLRMFFNFVVVYGHVMYFLTMLPDVPGLPFILSREVEPLLSLLSTVLFFFMYHAVDVFLFLSGYLFGTSFCGKKYSDSAGSVTEGTFTVYDVVTHMKNRFFRLFPVFFLAWLWSAVIGYEPCTNQSSILYEMFYVYNLKPGYGNEPALGHTCMLVTWSLSTDVQAHLVMAIIVLTFKTLRKAAFVLILLTVLTVVLRAQYMLGTLRRPMNAGMVISNMAKSRDELARFGKVLGLTAGNIQYEGNGLKEFNYKILTDIKMYVSPYMRASSAFIGFVTWYHVTSASPAIKAMQRYGTRTVLAAMSVILGLYVMFLMVPAIKPAPPMWIAVAHESVYRVLFTAAIAAVTVVAGGNDNQGKGLGSVVKLILKNGVTKHIAKLSYAIYLVHPFMMWVATEYVPRITAEHFELWRFVPSGLMVYAAAVVVALPCYYVERSAHAAAKSRGLITLKTKAVVEKTE